MTGHKQKVNILDFLDLFSFFFCSGLPPRWGVQPDAVFNRCFEGGWSSLLTYYRSSLSFLFSTQFSLACLFGWMFDSTRHSQGLAIKECVKYYISAHTRLLFIIFLLNITSIAQFFHTKSLYAADGMTGFSSPHILS